MRGLESASSKISSVNVLSLRCTLWEVQTANDNWFEHPQNGVQNGCEKSVLDLNQKASPATSELTKKDGGMKFPRVGFAAFPNSRRCVGEEAILLRTHKRISVFGTNAQRFSGPWYTAVLHYRLPASVFFVFFRSFSPHPRRINRYLLPLSHKFHFPIRGVGREMITPYRTYVGR